MDGAPEGTRTPGPLLRRQMLYPAELQAQGPAGHGAGDGNRTHTTSLEGWGSTTELHPHETPPYSSAALLIIAYSERRVKGFFRFFRNCISRGALFGLPTDGSHPSYFLCSGLPARLRGFLGLFRPQVLHFPLESGMISTHALNRNGLK